MRRLLLCLISAFLLAPAVTSAQVAADRDVLAVVQRLFDGMRAGDSAAVRAVFDPAARMYTIGDRNGAPALTTDSLDKFVRAIGTPHQQQWDERTANAKIHVDGSLAVVWADYTFYQGDKLSHCGVDTFQLFRGPAGWKVFTISDTRRREGCPEIPKR